MELRLLLAFLLMGAVMLLTPYFFKAPPSPAKNATTATTVTKTTSPAVAPAAKEQPAPAAAAAEPAGPSTPQQAAPPFVVNNGAYRVAFTNKGATVESWQLEKFKGNDNKPLELVNAAANLRPFSLYLPNDKPSTDINQVYYQQTPDPDGLGVTYEYTNGHTDVRKTFRFQKNSYKAEITAQVTTDGRPVTSMVEWRGGFGDLTVANPAVNQKTLYFSVPDNKLVEQTAKAAKNGPVTNSGDYSFAGIEDSYFAAAFLTEGSHPLTVTTFSNEVPTVLDQKAQQFAGVAVTDGSANHMSIFVGPKDVDLLRSINPKLADLVNFGWWSPIAKPLFLILNWADSIIHNFGWTIVIVTIFINVLIFPMRLTSLKSARKMQALKPQLDALNEKYKGMSLRDPRKAQQQQEQMELYKKNGINPMGGCLPSLIPMVLIIPFYYVIRQSAEMRGASWLWVHDLSQPEQLPIKLLPIAMIVAQFFASKMMPTTGDANQQRMMMLMPLIFGFMFYNLPSGLVLYYLTGTLVALAQQWFFNHTEAAKQATQSVEVQQPRKKVRK